MNGFFIQSVESEASRLLQLAKSRFFGIRLKMSASRAAF
jgi:hypothetical protein